MSSAQTLSYSLSGNVSGGDNLTESSSGGDPTPLSPQTQTELSSAIPGSNIFLLDDTHMQCLADLFIGADFAVGAGDYSFLGQQIGGFVEPVNFAGPVACDTDHPLNYNHVVGADTENEPTLADWSHGDFSACAQQALPVFQPRQDDQASYDQFLYDQVSYGQIPNSQFPNDQLSYDQIAYNQLSYNQIPSDQVPNAQVPNDQVLNNQFLNDQVLNQVLNDQVSYDQVPYEQALPNDQQLPFDCDDDDDGKGIFRNSFIQVPRSAYDQPSFVSYQQLTKQRCQRPRPPRPAKSEFIYPPSATPQEKQRLASSEFRRRNQQHLSQLQEWESEVHAENRRLWEDFDQLREVVHGLKAKVFEHAVCGDASIQYYLINEARRIIQAIYGGEPIWRQQPGGEQPGQVVDMKPYTTLRDVGPTTREETRI